MTTIILYKPNGELKEYTNEISELNCQGNLIEFVHTNKGDKNKEKIISTLPYVVIHS